MNDTQRAIEVFEKPSKHIRCAHECDNGMQFLTYSQDLVKAFETAIDGLKELQQYRSIGTVEECKEAMEKQTPHGLYYEADGYSEGELVYDMADCPSCGHRFEYLESVWGSNYCPNCGLKLDWSDSNGFVQT